MLVAKTKIRKILYDYYANTDHVERNKQIKGWLFPYIYIPNEAHPTIIIKSNLNSSTILLTREFIDLFNILNA